jgi:AraC family transcriptional regulator
MTGYHHVVHAIGEFEDSLVSPSGDLPIQTVAELARRTGYSVHHFTRLFSVVVGIPPKEYMLGRILTQAAYAVVGTDDPLRAISVRAGFQDYETFSRAFKRRFGTTPSSARASGQMPLAVTPRANPVPSHPQPGRVVADPEIVSLGEIHLAGLAFFAEEGAPGFHRQWELLMRVQSRIRERIQPESFYQLSSWPETEALAGLAILCAIRVAGGIEQEALFTTRTIPASTYLRFVHRGDVGTIRDTYGFIYRDYLATHDVHSSSSWEFQQYPADGTTEIYIPIDVRT